MDNSPLSWRTTERNIKARKPDWYWILGIIAAALAIASILFGNVLFAIVIVTGAVALGFASVGAANEYTITLTNRGVLIDSTLFPYENIISFCILEFENEDPVLSLRTKSIFAPQLSIPLPEGIDPYEVFDVLEYYVQEEEHLDGLFERFVDFLGF
tara:strand:+ start:4755 stop:5222 length:468 start_codon:yes stop_codon:yes gene_type:complete